MTDNILPAAKEVTLKLLAYCNARDWAGVDPYDAVNSRIFQIVPALNRRIPRLVLTQILRRSPINLRPLLLVPPTQNPKALGLFLASLLKLSRIGLVDGREMIATVVRALKALRAPDTKYWCWGYSFAWQTRGELVPRGAPNLVCTTFIANALLDAYDETGETRYLDMAVSSAEYILNELYWTEGELTAGLAYPLPWVRSNVHNGNFLGAALLCRIANYTNERKFSEAGLRIARFSASRQLDDGSWYYGELPTQRWIDNFHTGYNLCGLREIGQRLQTAEFDEYVRRGFQFYLSHFLERDGIARYFHDRTYPIDIHCVAQSIITLVAFKDQPGSIAAAHSVLRWAINNMWDERGFFYYRVLRGCTIRTPYMRWSEAWMLVALATFLSDGKPVDTVATNRHLLTHN